MRQGQGVIAAPIVVDKADVTEVFGPVIGMVSRDFLQGDDMRDIRF